MKRRKKRRSSKKSVARRAKARILRKRIGDRL